MGLLSVSRASAGTGKTYSICETIVTRVRDGLDPARILGTTFTVKAAAELKGRIQSRLLGETALPVEERIARAERLELACLGTVDSVAKQLLERFALELGLAPAVQVIEEQSSERYLRKLLRELPSEEWHEFLQVGERLSLVGDRSRAADGARILLALLEAKRSNQLDASSVEADLKRSADGICALLAPDGPDETLPGFDRLRELAREVYDRLPAPGDETKGTRDAKVAVRDLRSASRTPWAKFASAIKLKATKASDSLLASLREYASTVRRQPDLHADLRKFLELAGRLALTLDERYASFKKDHGVFDFTDLEVELLRLLSDPVLRPRVAGEFEFVVVDEFQDTSPLQLAIFAKLRSLIPESFWVGDEKQAIYGFRGADARLMRSVWDAAEKDARTSGEVTTHSLDTNYRSREGLVEFVNRTFEPVLGPTVTVNADRKPTEADPFPGAVERWAYEYGGRADRDPEFVARGVARWIEEGTAPGSIAVLARTGAHVNNIADALAARGVTVVVERPGLLARRECRVAVSGLRLVADARDGLAAATILHLLDARVPGDGGSGLEEGATSDPTPEWFSDRLRQLSESDDDRPKAFTDAPRLEPLWRLAKRSRATSPAECLVAVIAALELATEVPRWGEAELRASHLDALITHARAFEAECTMAGRPATLPGLVAYFEDLAKDEKDLMPALGGIDAVTVMTYHGAKGLEWDHVVLTQLDWKRGSDLWAPLVEGQTQPDRPLENRRLTYWPWPFGWGYTTIRGGTELEVDALATDRGRPIEEEHVAESLRLLYVGATRARERLAFATRRRRTPAQAWLDRVPDVERLFPQAGDEGEVVCDGVSALGRRRELKDDVPARTSPAESNWVDGAARPPAERATIDAFHSPSGLQAERDAARAASAEALAASGEDRFPSITLPGTPLGFARVEPEVSDRLGNALHQYLGALPSLGSADVTALHAVARSALDSWGFPDTNAEAVVEAGQRFQAWVNEHAPEAQWLTEVPVTAPRNQGTDAGTNGQWNGFIDLMLIAPDGRVILVDHKSAMIGESGWSAYAEQYLPQLDAYRSIVEQAGTPVAECWLHLPLSGGMVRVH